MNTSVPNTAHELLVSIVVPVYSGAAYLKLLAEKIEDLRTQLEKVQISIAECTFVVDEAIDNSRAVLQELAGTYPWTHVLVLSKNFGQHPATIAGIQHSSGDWIVTLDEDLQHDPSHIPELLLKAANENLDVVYAKSIAPVHGGIWRDLTSACVKRSLTLATGNSHIKNFNSFRVMRGTIARAAASSCAAETYFDVALCWYTNRIGVGNIKMQDIRYIKEKRSGYNFRSLLKHAGRLVMTSNTPIAKAGISVGLGAVAVSVALLFYALISYATTPIDQQVRGWASIMVTMLASFGLLSLLISLIFKQTSLLIQKAQGRPTYFTVCRDRDPELQTNLSRLLSRP